MRNVGVTAVPWLDLQVQTGSPQSNKGSRNSCTWSSLHVTFFPQCGKGTRIAIKKGDLYEGGDKLFGDAKRPMLAGRVCYASLREMEIEAFAETRGPDVRTVSVIEGMISLLL